MDPISRLLFGNFPIFRKNGIVAAILCNICLRKYQADQGLNAARFHVLHTLRSTKSTTASRNERGGLIRGSDPPLAYNAQATADDVWRAPTRLLLQIHLAAGVWNKRRQKPPLSPNGQKTEFIFERILRKTTGQHKQSLMPQSIDRDEFFSPVTTPMWFCPERRGVIVGCLYLEIEGQSWLVDNIDQGLM